MTQKKTPSSAAKRGPKTKKTKTAPTTQVPVETEAVTVQTTVVSLPNSSEAAEIKPVPVKEKETDAVKVVPITAPLHPAPKKEPAIGRLLKSARLEKGLTLREVSTKLCIRQTYLSAIEEGKYKSLPWAAYTGGFIRSYATFVGIDTGLAMQKYKEESASFVDKQPVLILPEPKKKFLLPKTVLIFVALAIAILIYIIWYNVFSTSRKVDIPLSSPILMASAVPPSVRTEPVPSELQDAADTPDAPPPVLNASDTVETVPSSPIQTANSSARPPMVPDVIIPSERLVAPEHAPETTSGVGQSFGVDPARSRVMIEATEDSWVEVTTEDRIHFSRVMQAGDRYYVEGDGTGFFMSTGNAKVLMLYVDDIRVPSFTGTVRRNLPLNADILKKH